MTPKQVTSPPWNSRRLVHCKEMVWASRWSVALRAFYRQILSLTYSFCLWNFRPRLVRALLVSYVSINALIVLNELLSRMGLFFNAKWGNGFTVGWFRVILRVDETCKTGGRVAHSCNRSWVSAVEYMVPCCLSFPKPCKFASVQMQKLGAGYPENPKTQWEMCNHEWGY